MQNKVWEAITYYSSKEEKSKSAPWSELRHYLGRLHSYRDAAEIIVQTSRQDPRLFTDPIVIQIRSSSQVPKPIRNTSLTAAEIIEHMDWKGEDLTPHFSQLQQLQKLGLDRSVKEQITKTKPFVHAEILVHNELLRCGISEPQEYWRGVKYIATSKPTCRLCSYYFRAHSDQVQVRPSHLNLYPNWRLPDISEEHGPETRLEQQLILQSMTIEIQNDVKKTLRELCPRGRNHDSNTYSGRPQYSELISSSTEMESDEKVKHYLQYLQAQVNTESLARRDTIYEESDHEDGGVWISP